MYAVKYKRGEETEDYGMKTNKYFRTRQFVRNP